MSDTDCVYCGCDVTAHDPVSVREWETGDGGGEDAGSDGDGAEGRELPFCNYGCLAAHIEEAGLALGTTCSVDASPR
jgi:hypothetical protein